MQGTSPSASRECRAAESRGDIKIEDNFIPAGDFLRVQNNTVAEDLQVFKNRGGGGKTVLANTVGENLQCKENDAPFVGQPNLVGGNAEDQCTQP